MKYLDHHKTKEIILVLLFSLASFLIVCVCASVLRKGRAVMFANAHILVGECRLCYSTRTTRLCGKYLVQRQYEMLVKWFFYSTARFVPCHIIKFIMAAPLWPSGLFPGTVYAQDRRYDWHIDFFKRRFTTFFAGHF